MGNLAVNLFPESTVQQIGALEASPAGLLVRVPSGTLAARRAASCLVEPESGDRVLVVCDPERPGISWILAVLERAPATSTRLVFDGDVQFAAPTGAIELVARDRVELTSPGTVEITGATLAVQAVDAQFAIERTSISGGVLTACVDRIKLVATSFDSVMDRLTQRVRMALRRVDELDQLHAGQVDVTARDTVTIHGANTIMTAEKLVKVDAAQIHVG